MSCNSKFLKVNINVLNFGKHQLWSMLGLFAYETKWFKLVKIYKNVIESILVCSVVCLNAFIHLNCEGALIWLESVEEAVVDEVLETFVCVIEVSEEESVSTNAFSENEFKSTAKPTTITITRPTHIKRELKENVI